MFDPRFRVTTTKSENGTGGQTIRSYRGLELIAGSGSEDGTGTGGSGTSTGNTSIGPGGCDGLEARLLNPMFLLGEPTGDAGDPSVVWISSPSTHTIHTLNILN